MHVPTHERRGAHNIPTYLFFPAGIGRPKANLDAGCLQVTTLCVYLPIQVFQVILVTYACLAVLNSIYCVLPDVWTRTRMAQYGVAMEQQNIKPAGTLLLAANHAEKQPVRPAAALEHGGS